MTVVFSIHVARVLVLPMRSLATLVGRIELTILKKEADNCLSRYCSKVRRTSSSTDDHVIENRGTNKDGIFRFRHGPLFQSSARTPNDKILDSAQIDIKDIERDGKNTPVKITRIEVKSSEDLFQLTYRAVNASESDVVRCWESYQD